MFETIVASLLNRYLSEYIDEVDYNNLKLGIFSGSIELLNIKIKPSALYQFDLPIDVKYGKIGKLKISISWKNILNKPTVLIIEDLYVLLGPFEEKINDPKRIEELLLAYKRKQLLEVEKIDKTEIYESKEKNFAERVQDTIINNIQIYINNIHIRYEDKHSLEGKVLSFGLYFKEFKAETVDENDKPNFLDANQKIIFKNGSLSGFNVYWNFGEDRNSLISLQQQNKDKKKDNWADLFKESITTGILLGNHFDKFMEENLNINVRLTLRRSYQNEEAALPKITFQSSLMSMGFVFSRQQYKSMLKLLDHYSMLSIHKKYVKYRPKELEKKKEDRPRLLWKYAFTAIAETTWRSFDRQRMLNHWKYYKLYMQKYEQMIVAQQKNKKVETKETEYLEFLEKILTLESILDIRSMIKLKYKIQTDDDQALKPTKPDVGEQQPTNFIKFRLVLNLPLITLSLKNANAIILKATFNNIATLFDLRSLSNSVYFLLNTQSINIDGIYYKDSSLQKQGFNHTLVPIVNSLVNAAGSSPPSSPTCNGKLVLPVEQTSSANNNMLFSFCFETNPANMENVEYRINLCVQSVEIFYERTFLTELLRFFRTDLIDFEEVKKIKEVWSKAGVIYAVENHKQFHINAELSSPYFILPIKGTCHWTPDDDTGTDGLIENTLIVFYLGKTTIQSQAMEKKVNYTPTDIKDLEQNFYDKLNLSVSDVQIVMIPHRGEKLNLNDYINTNGFKYHIIYPISTQNTVYISINPSYKKLPKLKLDATCSSIRFNFSNAKIVKLSQFAQCFPLPEVPKTSPTTGTVVSATESKKPTPQTASGAKPNKSEDTSTPIPNVNESTDIEPDDEWDGAFTLPKYINGDPISNYCQILCKFRIADFSIDLNESAVLPAGLISTNVEREYLRLVFDGIKIDFSITKYGMCFRAGLADLKLIDKLHRTAYNEHTEILSSSSTIDSHNRIIKLYFRKVEQDAPNFSTLYSNILTNILFETSSIHLACHRTAIVYFIKYIKSITDNLMIANKKSIPSVEEDPSTAAAAAAAQAAVDDKTAKTANRKSTTTVSNVCEFNLIAKMKQLTWNMFDTNLEFGNMLVKELSLNYNLSGIKTMLNAQLRKIVINYTSELTDASIKDNYRQIITCTGTDLDTKKFFNLDLILYDTTFIDNESRPDLALITDDCVRLVVGKIKVICLVKFVNEMLEFIDPIINPLSNSLTEQMKEQAIEAVRSAYQETQSIDKKMFIDIHITSPQVILPQNSKSLNAFLIDLGDLTIKNRFLDIPMRRPVDDDSQQLINLDNSTTSISSSNKNNNHNIIDEIKFALNNVEIKRVIMNENDANFTIKEQVIKPINLGGKLNRIVKNLEPTRYADIDIYVLLNDVECIFSSKSLRLLFAILDENLNEGVTPEMNKSLEQSASNKKNPAAPKKPTKPEALDRENLKIVIDLNGINLLIVEFVKSQDSFPQSQSMDQTTASVVDQDQEANKNRSRTINFSYLDIKKIRLDYSKKENESWMADFKIKELRLNDLRPDSNLAVKEMFVPLSTENYIIEVNYRVTQTQTAYLDFHLDYLKINLCLPYVLRLYQMAMDAISGSNSPQQAPAAAQSANKNKRPVSELAIKTGNKVKNITGSEYMAIKQAAKKKDTELNVIGKVFLPEVVLFAEPEKQDTKTLILNADIDLKFQSKNSVTTLSIELIELALRLGENNNLNKTRLGIPFLNPASASISMQQQDPSSPAQYKMTIDAFYFNMTPTLYQVVMGCINTLNRTGTETVRQEIVVKKLLEDAEPFIKHSIDPGQYNVQPSADIAPVPAGPVNAENEEEASGPVAATAPTKWTKLLESLELTINEMYMTFCEETGIDLQPLAIIKIHLDGRVSNWTRNLHLKAQVTLEASYYNDRISNWEPLIENIMQNEDEYRPWILSMWFALEPGSIIQPPSGNKSLTQTNEFPISDLDYTPLYVDHQPASDDQTEPGPDEDHDDVDQVVKPPTTNSNASFVLIQSNDVLNLNITPSAYRVCMYLTQLTAGSDKEFLENKEKPSLKFLNFMGETSDLVVSPTCHLSAEHATDFNLVYTEKQNNPSVNSMLRREYLLNERIKKIITDSQHAQIDSVYNENYKFQLRLAGFEPCKLSMKNDGSYLFQLKTSNKPPTPPAADIMTQSDEHLMNRAAISDATSSVKYNLLYKVQTLYGRTKVIFSSPLQIENNSQVKLYILVELTDRIDMGKFSKESVIYVNDETAGGDGKKRFSIVFELLPAKIFYVPLYIAYNCKLYATPNFLRYTPALIFDIRGYNLRIDDLNEVSCKRQASAAGADHHHNHHGNHEQQQDSNNDFYLLRQLSLNVKSVKNVLPAMHANYKVLLHSPIKLSNCLPLSIRFDVYNSDNTSFSSQLIEPGENFYVHLSYSMLKSCKLHVVNYLNTSWVGELDWQEFGKFKEQVIKLDMLIAPTTEMLVSGKHLSIYLSYKKPNDFMIYSPYWLVNKSGQPIKIKSNDTQRIFDIPDDFILFFDYKTISKRNKVRMAVRNGRWSSEFSLETAGTTGLIQCKDDRKTYNFLMRITMSHSSRSKLITFAPFLSIANQLDQTVHIREWHKQQKNVKTYEWQVIDPIDQTLKPISYWPNFVGDNRQVCFVLKLSNGLETAPFPLENPGRFVLIAKQPASSSQANDASTLPGGSVNLPTSASMSSVLSQQTKLITVLISGGNNNPVTIVIRPYQYGDSVAKFVNLCSDLTINLKQMNTNMGWQLEPLKSMFFVWPDLVKSSRELYWTVNKSPLEVPIKLTKSGNDNYSFQVEMSSIANNNKSLSNESDFNNEADTNILLEKSQASKSTSRNEPANYKTVNVSCVSYLDSTQRVIVFTTSTSLAEVERKKESSNMEIFFSIKGIQMSLINNVNLEIATISLKDSQPTWSLHTAEGNELKVFTNEYSNWLEKQYVNYLNQNSTFIFLSKNMNSINRVLNDNRYEIDFSKMTLIRPEKGTLKRDWQPGLLVQYRTSANLTSLNCSIYNFQIDNQLPDAYFPISFYKSTKGKTNKPMPFLTLNMFVEQQPVTQIFRYFDCVLQEFSLKMDKGFLFSLKDWYDAIADTSTKDDKTFDLSSEEMQEILNYIFIINQDPLLIDKMKKDLKLTKEIMEYANPTGSVKPSALIRFDEFRLSPIQFNLSFSVIGEAHTDDKKTELGTTDTILNFFLESIGATITEFKDVRFRFRPFNINSKTITWMELYDEIFDHYKIQTLHQAYVLILGLDVLGNPFGLVSDFSQGLTDLFYDPLLGYFSSSQDEFKSDEFKTKLATTVNQTISSVAGSGSLITGSIGRVLATCTFDREYKKKRLYKHSKVSTSSLPESLTIAGKGVVSGLIYGVTGIVKKPYEERDHGVKKLLSGFGKGCLGLFAKPVGSVFDGISLSLDSLKRVSQLGSESTFNARLPRHLINDIAILPYSEYQAKGYEILRDLHNDDIALDEIYWAHIITEAKHKTLIFITDKKIYKLKKTRTQILNKWELIEKPISLNKIIEYKTEAFDWKVLNPKKKSDFNDLPPNYKDIDLHQMIIISESDGSIFEKRNTKTGDENKRVLITSDMDTIQWIGDKINSAIKYTKESKSFIDI